MTRRQGWGAARAARGVAVGLGFIAAAGSLLSLSRSPRWYVRVWDFPRLQVVGLAATAAALYAAAGPPRSRPDGGFLAAMAATVLFQGSRIARYTPLARKQVERSRRPADTGTRLRLVIANVRRENRRYDAVIGTVLAEDPHVVLLLEVDGVWERALRPLAERYPHVVAHPRENHYGMILLSRLPLEDSSVEFMVQDDIPSIHTTVLLGSGARVRLHGVHPRPPEPQHGQDSTPRDAELVLLGRRIGERAEDAPTVVAGDLNDVAWSRTTRLFLRLGELLDPRIGRGFYNSYNADNPLLRWPLDHVFHSGHFRLVELKRLGPVGSDHFPMLVELSLEPDAHLTQGEPEATGDDRRLARERLRQQGAAERSGEDQHPE
jgi:endonuclease/exonuclease/phosphatase (EEP) superfamily protein YafD